MRSNLNLIAPQRATSMGQKINDQYTPPAYGPAPTDSLYTNTQSDAESAADTGFIFLAGMLIRETLQKCTGKLFSKYLSKQQDIDPKDILNVSLNMLKDKRLMKNPQKATLPNGDVMYHDVLNKLNLVIENTGQNAHFDPLNKEIRVSKNTLLSIPHEIGHAVQEHSTKFLKRLQRSRGNYTIIALILYGLGRSKSNEPEGKESLIGKLRNTLYKYNLLVPLLAFSPELITEFEASRLGLEYMKKAKVPPKLLSAARKHYAVAFCTYLALPAFAILDNFIFKKTAN